MDLSNTLLKDRFYLSQQAKKLSQLAKDASKQEQAQQLNQKITQRYEQSCALYNERQAIELAIGYPDLPVSEQRDELMQLISDNQVVIIAGETGSGKTTQLPKMCLELGYGRKAMIAHTQPRRVAASAVARRISDELAVKLGEQVGYQVRFTDNSGDNTLLKVMTDGVLLAEIAHDRFLEKYDCIIIDEAHERSLNIDFLLGYLKRILPKRPDLKLIITSATIDVERFAKHFGSADKPAPSKTISGRTFPVELRYTPLEELSSEHNISEAIALLVDDIDHSERKSQQGSRGDILVFLPGEKEIRDASKQLRHSNIVGIDVLPLYARLNHQDQQKIFQPSRSSQRRIVLATNVAETSLTVPGIRYVIDAGLARMSRYSARSKVQQLPIEKVSQASANQRAGRCGRVEAGICYRLYSEEDFNNRPEFTDPEIKRTNLSAVILQMQLLRIGHVAEFPFVESPDKRLINDGYKQLFELGALDDKQRLTNTGRTMARLPIDPKLGRILLQANTERCLHEALIIVSGLSLQDVREVPSDKKEAARQKHSEFKDPQSDFMSLLNLWQFLEEQRQSLSNNQFKKMCQKRFLSIQRVFEWREIHRQLLSICQQLKLKNNQDAASYEAIHKSLLVGFANHIGFQRERKTFMGARNREFVVFPGSHLYSKPPKWLMAAELIDTSQLYAHRVAKIEPEWVLSHLTHLLKFTYSEPHFSRKQGQVMAFEKSTLYGLMINEKRAVAFNKIDPEQSRELFIREGLVAGLLNSQAKCYQHNQRLKKQVLALEDKTRRRDLLASDDYVFNFYHARIPEHINSASSFESWLKKTEQKQKAQKNKSHSSGSLFADISLFQANDLSVSGEQFPKFIEVNGAKFNLSYKFSPGDIADGVSVDVAAVALNRVPKFLFQWLVPGLMAEKCEALLKTLPKQWRKHLVPLPDAARKIVPELQALDEPMHHAIARVVSRHYKINIPLDAWQLDKLDNYYLMNYRVLDAKNRLLGQSRDFNALLAQYGSEVKERIAQTTQTLKSQRYSRWEFDDLMPSVDVRQGKSLIKSYSVIEDKGAAVELGLVDYPSTQLSVHRRGLSRLASLYLNQQIKYLQKQLLKKPDILLKLTAGFQPKPLLDDLLLAACRQCFFDTELVFNKADFEQRLTANKSELASAAMALENIVEQVFTAVFNIRKLLRPYQHVNFTDIRSDIEQQIQALLYPGFLYATPSAYLHEYPRYFQAIEIRLQRLQGNVKKEQQAVIELASLNERLIDAQKANEQVLNLEKTQQYRWMMEEYRVSLFAQQLKTRYPVSKKRLDKLWAEAELEQKLDVYH